MNKKDFLVAVGWTDIDGFNHFTAPATVIKAKTAGEAEKIAIMNVINLSDQALWAVVKPT